MDFRILYASLIGAFLHRHRDQITRGDLPEVQVHTKYVPDLDLLPTLKKQDVEWVIDRSLQRLGVERLDLVQFHWWDYGVPGCLEAAGWLRDLQQSGKIDRLSLTNFNTQTTREILDAAVPVGAADPPHRRA